MMSIQRTRIRPKDAHDNPVVHGCRVGILPEREEIPITESENSEGTIRSKLAGGDVSARCGARRVSTTLRQVFAKFSEFFMCWVFP